MRVYSEMECDCSCEDGILCEYFSKERGRCDCPNEHPIEKEKKKKHWWQR